MSYFTERNHMRAPINKTEIITSSMYSLLIDCCKKYLNNIAWKFPKQCPDGKGICGLNYKKFEDNLKFDIPELYRDYNNCIVSPPDGEEFNQYALLDYIELIAQNIKDISSRFFHSYFGHYDISFQEGISSQTFLDFQKEINAIFQKTGLLYILTDRKEIERVVEYDVLSEKVETITESVGERGTRELLEEAIKLYRNPRPENQHLAVEKIWDALERLKTYYSPALDKRHSADKIVNAMGHGDENFIKLFVLEFKELTDIGNNYRIRHHETTKIDIVDSKHFDYFFNRCLSLIALALQYL